jgi:hypothetical protein
MVERLDCSNDEFIPQNTQANHAGIVAHVTANAIATTVARGN